MSGRTVLCYHPRYDGRGFSPVQRSWGRYRAAWELFQRLGLLDAVRPVRQRPADPVDLLPVHPPEYVEYVRRRDAEGTGSLDGRDTPAWTGVFARALTAVGGSLDGADMIGSGAATHVFNPGGGLHHAHRAQASGFCIFNDVALAVLRLRQDYGLTRVAVVDVDGHHGDGTQELFYDQPVLCLSLHQYDGRFFPGTGSADEVGWGHGYGYSVTVGLPRHTGDAAYGAAFGAVVPEALRRYRPEAILLNFGVDGHFADPLVRLSLSTATYRAVAATVHALAHELCAGRLLVFGSGGYHPQHAARCWATLLAVLADLLPAGTGPWPARLAELQDGDCPPTAAAAPAAAAAVAERVCAAVLPLIR